MDELAEYRAVVAKVSAFTAEVSARRAKDLACRAGCDACCQVELEVSPVEAEAMRRHLGDLPAEERARIAARARDGEHGRCALLDADGRCAAYEARPLVCRTEGHALRYPEGFVPVAAVRASAGGGDVAWCGLNYRERAPGAGDVLDAERVDSMLAVVNRRFAEARGEDPLVRAALRMIASAMDCEGISR